MKNFWDYLQLQIQEKCQTIGFSFALEEIVLQNTKAEFVGEITLVLFHLASKNKVSPQILGEKIGNLLKETTDWLLNFEIIQGFLNMQIKDLFWLEALKNLPEHFDPLPPTGQLFLVEYSSPNTNKPLHLGHLRNNFLGYSVAELLKFQGHQVKKVQIINDRGVHICKSMLAYQKFGQGETPQSSGIKGDKLVGKYYVLFEKAYKEEMKQFIDAGKTTEWAEKNVPMMLEVQTMLQNWEAKDPNTIALWEKMNVWVYAGFEQTYKNLKVDFDQLYYESKTYLKGKELVQLGLQKNIFYQKEDGAIACDLSADGLDEKILQRKDGTSMYITQDLGTALARMEDFPQLNGVTYVVASEQDYHFKVLFLLLKKLGFEWAKNCFHLSYGMVELPSGKMKSREGTVVDADDLLQELIDKVEKQSDALGKLEDLGAAEKKELYHSLALAALKYFLLKVDPRKKMLFNPEESLQLQGDTALFVQYGYVRMYALLKKVDHELIFSQNTIELKAAEKKMIVQLSKFYNVCTQAATQHNPSLLVSYMYELVKTFNSFYQSVAILKEENENSKNFRLLLIQKMQRALEVLSRLIGMDLPQRM